MATTKQDQPQACELTALSRVASIPLIASSLDQIHTTLSSNVLTRSPYHAAQVLGQTAYSYSQPLQIRLRPFIVSADDLANKGLDVIQQKYPYPFEVKPEEVASYVRQSRDSVMSTANETFGKTVKTPAVGVAEGIDKRFTPIVDYFEIAVNKVGSESGASSPTSSVSENQYQYQRAYALSKHLKENLYVYSAEHLTQLQQHSVVVQKAIDTAGAIQSLASASLTGAQSRVHDLSDSMLQELQKVQQSAAALPHTLQSTLPDISQSVKHMGGIWTAPNTTLQEKVNRTLLEVNRLSPTLEKICQRAGDLAIAIGIKKKEDAAGAVHNENGHAAQ